MIEDRIVGRLNHIADSIDKLTHEVRLLREAFMSAPIELLRRPITWSCDCGFVNGANLAVCSICGRKPGAVE